MANNDKVFLINSSSYPTAKENTWTNFSSKTFENLIMGIVTSEGESTDQTELFRAMISGVPSPWARVLITRNALAHDEKNLGNSVLDECYKLFISEWKGLVAAYSIHPDSFEFSAPIPLTGLPIEKSYGDMNVLNIYGEMLFEEDFLWTLKKDALAGDNPPCIQILYYKKSDGKRVAVAATSPYNLLFASVSYNLPESEKSVIPWIDNGKFIDPTGMSEDKIKVEDLQRLYSFINNVRITLDGGNDHDPGKYYKDYICELCITNKQSDENPKNAIEAWNKFLMNWSGEVEDRIKAANKEVNSNIPISVPRPEGPLAMLLNSERTFYVFNGETIKNMGSDSAVEIKSSEILMQGEVLAGWKSSGDPNRDYAKAPVYYLRCGEWFFALPLSDKSVRIFGNNIHKMISSNKDEMIKLTAKVNENKVDVELKARIDGAGELLPICKKTYNISLIPEAAGKVFVWPDFKSDKWCKYFYYSEFPTNVSGIRMIPQFEEGGQITDIIKYPVNKVSTSMHKYEIIESNKPLSYVCVNVNNSGKDVNAGTLLLKKESFKDDGSSTKDSFGDGAYLKNKAEVLSAATVGFDFGSTNSCAYYVREMNTTAEPVPFKNRRLAIVGFDNPKLSMAQKDELLFISNEGTLHPNGQIKSWLHEHDSQYLAAVPTKALSAAVPVNESNIPIVAMDDHAITTNAGKMYYNMKWLSDEKFIDIKTSFSQMLWYQICADLMDANLYPKELRWSFPTAMSPGDIRALKNIYESSTSDSPFWNLTNEAYLAGNLADTSYTEAEADAAFAFSSIQFEGPSKLLLGIDVGGSTSDIFIMNNRKELLTQSSIRLASGFFFKAINSSPKFRKAVYDFHEMHTTGVKVLNIEDIISNSPDVNTRAPHYLNNVFDQLNSENDFKSFYSRMQLNVPNVFTLPAYVTGILLFYSGMLVKNAIEKNNYQNIVNEVDMKYYGKGGRLFEWVTAMFGKSAETYYAKCFNLGTGRDDIEFHFNMSDKEKNKSEVAIGLSSEHIRNFNIKKDDMGYRVIENFDIIGEEGIRYYNADNVACDLKSSDIIPDDLFKNGMSLELPKERVNFNKFLDVFLNFVERGGLMKNMSILEEGRKNIKAILYMQNDPEYLKYLSHKDEKNATYRMPVIIAEALSYLNDTLLPAVAKEMN